MRVSQFSALTIVVLSVIAWVALYFSSDPQAAPSREETIGLVGVVSIVVLSVAAIVTRRRKRPDQHD